MAKPTPEQLIERAMQAAEAGADAYEAIKGVLDRLITARLNELARYLGERPMSYELGAECGRRNLVGRLTDRLYAQVPQRVGLVASQTMDDSAPMPFELEPEDRGLDPDRVLGDFEDAQQAIDTMDGWDGDFDYAGDC